MEAPPPTVLCFKCGQSGAVADPPPARVDRLQHMHHCACTPRWCSPSVNCASLSHQWGLSIMCETSDVPACHCTHANHAFIRVCPRHAILLYKSKACAGHWSRDCTLAPSEWQRKPAEAPVARPAQPPAVATPALARTSTQGTPARRSGELGGYGRGTDAQRPGEGALQQRPKGCYKCGKSGKAPPACLLWWAHAVRCSAP